MLQEYSGQNLKALRKRARLTQMQVVEMTGVSEATICYLERGQRKPQTKTLEKLLSLYAIRITYWKNLEKAFEESSHGGNFTTQATVGTGSAGFNAVRTAPKAQDERQVRLSHGVPRL